MKQMMRFQGKRRRINIPQEIGEKYFSFGVFLLQDSNGHLVRNIEGKHCNDYYNINIAILEQWVKNGSQVTWKTLMQTLEDIQLNRLADEIRDVVQLCSPSQ